MTVDVDLQVAVDDPDVPPAEQFQRWAAAAIAGRREAAELTIRVVSAQESRALNEAYRGRPRPTNVLGFAAELPAGIALPLLGDVVICSALVSSEAREQGKSEEAHWAHLVVHGCLHLLGFDHESKSDAAAMEGLETAILTHMGYPDPYQQQLAQEPG